MSISTNSLYTENFPHMAPVWSRIFNFVAERAEGSYIYTDDGRRLLDFTCGIGVTNTGQRRDVTSSGEYVGLPARDRAALMQSQAEKYPEEYAPMIEQYLRNLSDESQKR